MKLISMTDFVLKIQSEIDGEDYQVVAWQTKIHGYDRILKYTNLLKQPLTIGMFVPCDYNVNILEEVDSDLDIRMNELKIYNYAKSKVIFEGFSVNSQNFIHNTKHYYIQKDSVRVMWNFNNEWNLYDNAKTIEDLIPYNLDLTGSF